MKITWKDIKDTVYNMMFLDSGEYNDYKTLIPTAANYALLELSKNFALTDSYSIEQEVVEETGYNQYDLKELTKINDTYVFLGFAGDMPVSKITEYGYQPVMDYDIAQDRYLSLNKMDSGNFVVNYKKYPTKITESTLDTFEIDLQPEVANLVPLIMGWRIFLDDDITRATLYYNEYMTAKEELLGKTSHSSGIDVWGGVEF